MSEPRDLRLIEDYLPIEAISAEASREKSVRKGHISTLHLWWARRPLVACRAAVYGSLVPADRWVKEVKLKNPPGDPEKAERVRNGKKLGLNRKAAAEFVTRLCKYPGEPRVIADAQKHILEAHAERLTAELAEGRQAGKLPAWVEEFDFLGRVGQAERSPTKDGTVAAQSDDVQRKSDGGTALRLSHPTGLSHPADLQVTVDDILTGRAPRPRVLDMFAGGGAIPLEALRLGCEAYALDLNPVAHIIELCTLVYPQKYGKPEPTTRGMTGPKNAEGETTWGGLAAEVRYWGNWVLKKVKADIGDLYPLIPDPNATADETVGAKCQKVAFDKDQQQRLRTPKAHLTPVAYLWTRTVRCKNPSCGATVPLVKQTWLCKKKNRCVALRMSAPKGQKQVRFEVVESATEKGIGFDPTAFSKAGNATCPFCGTVADSDYVMAEGCATRISQQMMATVCVRPGKQGKTYIAASGDFLPPDAAPVQERIADVSKRHGLSIPNEPISPLRPSPNARGLSGLTRYGISDFGRLFTSRQHLLLISLCDAIRSFSATDDRSKCIATYLAVLVGRIANQNCAFTGYHSGRETLEGPMGDKKVPMVWDFPEANPFGGVTGGVDNALEWILDVCGMLTCISQSAQVQRGDATRLDMPNDFFDAVVTDPPYYDNVPYADISDFFYVWFKRAIGHLYPEHFSTLLTPKKAEATALASRYDGDMTKANAEYESAMSRAFREAHRVLKPGGEMVVVYAHKTTLGWATLVDALRQAGLVVTEAWPLDTEMAAGKVKIDRAMLASSIFLIARKRELSVGTGNYEDDVQPELERIVRGRVESLWEMGITGADLLIAGVGAGLRAFTRFDRVEYANGEEMPANRFLAEVEAVVLDALMARIFGASGGVSAVDPHSRFYVVWRYVYKAAEIDAGEAIVFANGTHVELDGPEGLTAGSDAIMEKKKGKYRLRDFTERGDDEDLGMPLEDGQPAPIIDALQRTLWLMENRPTELPEYLREAQPNREQMRLVAQALAGPGLKGGELADVSPSAEQAALGKLTANWRSVVEDAVTTTAEREAKRTGQKTLDM